MARMATRIASGLAAAGIATIMSVTPAAASVADPQGSGGYCTVNCTSGPGSGTTESGTNWLRIALGGAGGIAVVGAGVATVSSRNRRESQEAHPA